jgi:peroxiredoxin
VDDLSQASYAVEALGLEFPVLYDQTADVVKEYGVYNASAGYANPTVFIVDSNGSVVWKHRGSASHRTPNRDIISQLEKLT